MAEQIQTRRGTCAKHGAVDAERAVPRPSFPFFVYAVRRALASRRPFRCPECGAPASV